MGPAAGYSGTPLPKKLGIKEGARLFVLREPEGFRVTLGGLPHGVQVNTRLGRDADVIVAFFKRRSDLEGRIAKLIGALDVDGGLWIGCPKRASGVATDITEDILRELGLPLGLVDNKVWAIDETWSGLRLVFAGRTGTRSEPAAARGARRPPPPRRTPRSRARASRPATREATPPPPR